MYSCTYIKIKKHRYLFRFHFLIIVDIVCFMIFLKEIACFAYVQDNLQINFLVFLFSICYCHFSRATFMPCQNYYLKKSWLTS